MKQLTLRRSSSRKQAQSISIYIKFCKYQEYASYLV